jgi:Spy/CpxP family protein refolding chaperone
VKAWKVICATLVIFCAGFVAGGLVVRELSAPAAPPPATWSGQTKLQTLLRRMDRELALTPEQHDQVEKIISASQEKMREVSKPVSLEMRKQTVSACAQIRALLTPDQQVKFDTLSKTRSSRSDHGGDWDDHDGHGKHHSDHDFDADAMTNFTGHTN